MRVTMSIDRPGAPPPASTEIDRTHTRLDNFGRWSRDAIEWSTCGSAEKHFIPERLGVDEEEARRRARELVDALDAERVWRALMPGGAVPPSHVRVLQGVYVHRLRGEDLRDWLRLRGIGVQARDLAALERAALLSAAAVLR